MAKKEAKEKVPRSYPNFLLIGAPECGCDIIKTVLQKNQKVWFPPLDNILAFHSAFQIERIQIAQQLWRGEIPFKLSKLRWYINYFLQPVPTKKWYLRLIHNKEPGIIKGELSDEYITLPFDEVEKLYETMPECKIVMMIRNPVERSFASIREKFKNNAKTPLSKLTKRQLVTLMNSDWARTHSAFQNAIDSWPVFFPRSQIFIGFYQDLINSPENFFEKLHAFLEIPDAAPVTKDSLALPPQQAAPFPQELIKHLHPFYRREVEGLATRLGGHATAWFAAYPAPARAKPKAADEPKPDEENRVQE